MQPGGGSASTVRRVAPHKRCPRVGRAHTVPVVADPRAAGYPTPDGDARCGNRQDIRPRDVANRLRRKSGNDSDTLAAPIVPSVRRADSYWAPAAQPASLRYRPTGRSDQTRARTCCHGHVTALSAIFLYGRKQFFAGFRVSSESPPGLTAAGSSHYCPTNRLFTRFLSIRV